MTETVTIYPDAFAPAAERFRAYFDPERTPYGFGPTSAAAALDLYRNSETPEETLACIVAIMRADLKAIGNGKSETWVAGYVSAIGCVEGID
jgi:hypothetical protein